MSEDARLLIERAVRSFLEEVPALKPLKLIQAVVQKQEERERTKKARAR